MHKFMQNTTFDQLLITPCRISKPICVIQLNLLSHKPFCLYISVKISRNSVGKSLTSQFISNSYLKVMPIGTSPRCLMECNAWNMMCYPLHFGAYYMFVCFLNAFSKEIRNHSLPITPVSKSVSVSMASFNKGECQANTHLKQLHHL